MNKNLFKLVTSIILISGFSSASAELLVNPVSKSAIGAWEGSGYFGISSVEYEVGGSSGDIDRNFLGATFAYGLNNSLDVYGSLAYTLKAELENSTTDGSGYMLGGGVRGKIPAKMDVALHGYAQLLFIDEDYGGSPEVSGEETYLMAGVVASKALDNNIKLYGGLELNLYSDMDIGAFGTVSAERDNFLGIRLGANFTTGSLLWNINTALIDETGLFISASSQF